MFCGHLSISLCCDGKKQALVLAPDLQAVNFLLVDILVITVKYILYSVNNIEQDQLLRMKES